MQRFRLVFIFVTLLTVTLYAEYDADTATDNDIAIADEDISDIDSESSDIDTTEPNYDDYNFPDVPESTDHDAIKTERITADGCSSLFVQ